MARGFAGEIANLLMAHGRAADEPAALVSDATSGKQNVDVTTLAQLGEAAAASTAPAIIVIGENVKLREGLDWLGAMSGRLLNPDPLGRDTLSDVG
jgi:uroporphyrin-III C-methyltransferase